MNKNNANRFRFRIEILIEWPKGLFRAIGGALKRFAIAIAELAEQLVFWFRNPWRWL